MRQGTGEYVARELQRAGCEVVGVVGTSPASIDEARAGLRERHGIDARGYRTVEELIARERPEVVAICSPTERHLESLEAALAAGCHVLCEKPLLWDPDFATPEAEPLVVAAAERLVDLAERRGKHLALNTQWPFTLDAFRQLHPGACEAPLRDLAVWLGPDDPGPRMVLESASHPLSLLYALVGPEGEVEAPELAWEGEDGLTVAFRYAHPGGAVAVELALRRCPQPPRPAAYRINGRRVDREIGLPGYTFSFVAAGEDGAPRRVPFRDPLALSVEAFLAAARAGRPPDRRAIVQGVRHLHRLVVATEQSVWSRR